MKRKSGFKIFCSTALVIFNLFVCFMGTMAWFTAARKNDASGMQVQMYTHELDMSYKIYKYEDDEKEIIDATGRADALSLQMYDSVFTDRNINTSLILDFNITGMSLGEDISVLINAHCTQLTTNTKHISNIIKMQFANITTITSSDPNVIYEQVNNFFDNQNIPEQTFKTGDSKVQDIQYNLNNYQVTNGFVRLFIRIDYSEDLISDFLDGSLDVSDTDMIFEHDLDYIRCEVDED